VGVAWGRRDPGETARQAVVREMAEETGIGSVDLDFVAVAEVDLRRPSRREYLTMYREDYAKPSLKKYRPIAARNEGKKVFSGLL
jgi:8-oxo-dGTP pyrophosphatase MutT (NUDIX family)